MKAGMRSSRLTPKQKLELIRKRLPQLRKIMEKCRLCPRACGVNRLKDEIGDCGVGRYALLASYGPHFGEEPVLVGRRCSGTVFFAGCNLACVFCQNYDISHLRRGYPVDAETLASVFLEIQRMGCHNLNLVSPTHVSVQIVEALEIAFERGFDLPIVYNTGGYDPVRVLKLLDGIIDIYMPDIKYSDSKIAEKYSGVKHYWEVVRAAVREMQRQVGDLDVKNGIAQKGLLIRHLVLPNRLAGSFKVVDFIVEEVSKDAYVNIMDQYYPAYKAFDYPELSRRITRQEYWEVVRYAMSKGIHRGIPFGL